MIAGPSQFNSTIRPKTPKKAKSPKLGTKKAIFKKSGFKYLRVLVRNGVTQLISESISYDIVFVEQPMVSKMSANQLITTLFVEQPLALPGFA